MKIQSYVLPLVAVLVGCSCLASGCSQKQPPPSLAQSKPTLPPLIQAAADGEPEQVRHLLDQGVDVNIRSDAPHEKTAMQAAIYHRQNDVERIGAVPPDPAGEAVRNQPIYGEGAAKDEDYREVIGMLRQAALDARKITHTKTYDQQHRTHHHA